MDEILYLEPDEEITSIIDKLKENPATSVALVVPQSATIFQSLVNLKLLKKEAQALRKEIALVTADKVGINLAAQVGITVFKDVNDSTPIVSKERPSPPSEEVIEIEIPVAKGLGKPKVLVHHFQEAEVSQAKVEPRAKPSPKPFVLPKISGKFWTVAIFLILASLGLYLLLPKTTLVLGVKTSPLEEEVSVYLDASRDDLDPDQGILPGQYSQLEEELEKTFQASGKKNVGQKASGEITVSNKTGEVVKLAGGSRFQSSGGLIFLSSSEGLVPAATATVDPVGNVTVNPGKASLKVTADQSGEKYNLDPQKFTILDVSANKRDNIFGQSLEKFSGGSTKEVMIVSKDDLEKAKADLKDRLFQKLKEQVQGEVGKKRLVDDALSLEILDFQSSAAENAEKSEFSAKSKAKMKALAFLEDDFRKVIVSLLQKKMSPDRMLLLRNDDEILITVSEKDLDKGTMTLSGKIKTKTVLQIAEDDLKREIAGKSKSEAKELLERKETIEKAEIKISPSFFKSIPRFKNQIKIKYEYLDQAEEDKKP